MKIVNVICILFLILFAVQSNGQVVATTGTLKGFVYENISGEPLTGATVGIKGLGKGAKTDINGFFNIPKLSPGSYTLVASSIGFETYEKEVII